MAALKVLLRNPRREVALDPVPSTVGALLGALDIVPESVLVIRNGELVTRDAQLRPDDVVEVRPVMSGGAA